MSIADVELVQGDITEQGVDAIVNAANSGLLGGGGVDGAIHRRGGPDILAECRQLRASRFPDGLPPGAAVATTAGDLDARWVIHTVGPVFAQSVDRSPILHSCYRSSLDVAAELGAGTIAFPLISAGIYRWPKDDAIAVALSELSRAPAGIRCRLVLFDEDLLLRARRLVAST
jgi:O-acetyl-ADP-ribose deacetylase (regulator of RNase III)